MSSSSISFMGSYSGITMETIEQLLQAESAKVVSYTNKQSSLEAEKTAWKDVQTRLTNLSTKMAALTKPETYQSKTVEHSQDGKIVFSAGTKAISGDYSVSVERLATRTQVTGSKLELGELKKNEAWGKTGTFTLTSQKTDASDEAKPFEIKVEESDSLATIINKINEGTKDSGISAVIIDDRIVLQDTEFGDRTISISDSEGTLSTDLGLADALTVAGHSAKLTVNGIAIERDSNKIMDVMDGVTLELKAVTTEPIQVTVTEDTATTEKAIKDFVDQYNSTMSFISSQLDVGDPSQEGNITGSLTGDSNLMRLQSQLRSLLSNTVNNGNEGMNTAELIGISVDREGVATLDTEKLQAALKEDSSKVSELFQFTTTSTTLNEAGETVEVEDNIGIAQKFESLINSFTDSKEGIIATKNETYDKLINDLTKQIDKFNARLEVKREQYIAKFTALDIAMMEAESQLSYMASQFGTSSDK